MKDQTGNFPVMCPMDYCQAPVDRVCHSGGGNPTGTHMVRVYAGRREGFEVGTAQELRLRAEFNERLGRELEIAAAARAALAVLEETEAATLDLFTDTDPQLCLL